MSRFPAPKRLPQAQRGLLGGCGCSGSGSWGSSTGGTTAPCRGKACCIKPTADAEFCVKTVEDQSLPIEITNEVEVTGCIGVQMCGSEPICVQLENKPDTSLCSTTFTYTPVSTIVESVGCGYGSSSFEGVVPGTIDPPFYYATNVPVVCAPSDKIVRIKSLQQRFNGPADVNGLSAGLTGWKVASTGQTLLQSNSFAEMDMNYSLINTLTGVPCDMNCSSIGTKQSTLIYSAGQSFGENTLGIDLAPNDVMLGTMEVANPNDVALDINPYYVENTDQANVEIIDFKTVSSCQNVPECLAPVPGVQETFITDLQVFPIDDGEGHTLAVSFCIVDCENVPISDDQSFVVELTGQAGLAPPFSAGALTSKFAEPNKYEAKFSFDLTNLITVSDLTISQNPSSDILFTNTQTFILGNSA